MIEVELRGPLSLSARKTLLSYCKKYGALVGEFNQLAIFCDTWNEVFGSFYDAKMRIALQLSSVVNTGKKKFQLKIKHGHVEKTDREEIIVSLRPDELNCVFDLLRALHITSGCPRFYHRIDYRVGNILLSLKDGGLLTDHWEAEIQASQTDVENAQKSLQLFLNKRELVAWSEEEYRKLIDKIYKENPPVKFSEIDISQVQER